MHVEAARWVAGEIGRLRGLSYEELLERQGTAEHVDLVTEEGEELVGETQVYWDGSKGGDLRVVVMVSRTRGIGAYIGSVASDDFILAPDGSFVDE